MIAAGLFLQARLPLKIQDKRPESTMKKVSPSVTVWERGCDHAKHNGQFLSRGYIGE